VMIAISDRVGAILVFIACAGVLTYLMLGPRLAARSNAAS
jgi:hypothetical protein